ncbi:hypothetical protein M2360_004890 [Rhizobium sp. SG_E_25_P2]|uniref:hypothetical protein n=1 Tax=Rhizobium sp. SG_E_25_P2 TaxID=2879942 RepID=UPI0024762369|nr:hypothetical protein [Rhizobium sp. SG_E_25_P2]MDH6269462.1 hypothetical protein [Rhizobium sp. SG_E_25_P2]
MLEFDLDGKRIWLAWNGGNRAVIGYPENSGHAPPGATSAGIVIAVAHTADAAAAGVRSGVVVDAFPCHYEAPFLRPITLPAGTSTLELLIWKEPRWMPLKTFELTRQTDDPLDMRAITLNAGNDGMQAVWRLFAEQKIRDLLHGGGVSWALHLPADADNSREATRIGRLKQVIPRPTETVRLTAETYELSTPPAYAEDDWDDDVPAIEITARKSRRIAALPIAVESSVDDPELLNGLYVVHILRQRTVVSQWNKALADHAAKSATPGSTPPAAMRVPDVERDLLILIERQIRAGMSSLQGFSLFKERRMYNLGRPQTEPGSGLDIIRDDKRYLLRFYHAARGDHIVFYDTRSRHFRVEDRDHGTGTVSYLAGPNRFIPLPEGHYEGDPLVAELQMSEPPPMVSRPSRTNASPALRNWLKKMGAPEEPQELSPLLADAAGRAHINGDMLERDWDLYQGDGAAYLLARTLRPAGDLLHTQPGSSFERHPGVAQLALRLIGAAGALSAANGVEEQAEAALFLLENQRTDALEAVLATCREFDPTRHNALEIAAVIRQISAIARDRDFLDALQPKDRDLHANLVAQFGDDGALVRQEPDALLTLLSALVAAKRDIDAEREKIRQMLKTSDTTGDTGERHKGINLQPRAEKLLVALERISDEDARHYRSILDSFEGTVLACQEVIAAIERKYPSLESEAMEAMTTLLSVLETWAGIGNMDETRRQYVLRRISQQATAIPGELMKEADELRGYVSDWLGTISRRQGDKNIEIADLLPGYAKGLVIMKARSEIDKLVVQARAAGLTVPPELLRALQVWPRRCRSTWQAFSGFAGDPTSSLGINLPATLALPRLPAAPA